MAVWCAKAGHHPLRNACFFSTDFQHQRQSWMALWWQKQDTTLSETPAFLVLAFYTKAKLNGRMMAKAIHQALRNGCFSSTDFQHQRQSWMAVWWQKQDVRLSETASLILTVGMEYVNMRLVRYQVKWFLVRILSMGSPTGMAVIAYFLNITPQEYYFLHCGVIAVKFNIYIFILRVRGWCRARLNQ